MLVARNSALPRLLMMKPTIILSQQDIETIPGDQFSTNFMRVLSRPMMNQERQNDGTNKWVERNRRGLRLMDTERSDHYS